MNLPQFYTDLIRVTRSYFKDIDDRLRVAGWRRKHWKRYAKAQYVLHTEQAKWYSEQAEDPTLEYEEHNKRVAMAIMHSNVAQAFGARI